jgi:polysaccharide pyruvyl transferase WcaK-like protein
MSQMALTSISRTAGFSRIDNLWPILRQEFTLKTILLIGSYNGQDSFGDKGLIRSVVTNFRHQCGAGITFLSHIHENIEDVHRVTSEVVFKRGFSPFFRVWFAKLRHLRLPKTLHLAMAVISFPCWMLLTAENRRNLRDIICDMKQASCLYFYGGTQLSEQWFNFNFPPLAFTILISWILRRPVYFGPQQYGPENHSQQRWLKLILRLFVCDVRVRNAGCLKMLELPQSKLLLDEIYSCSSRLPICSTHQRKRSFILINMRGSNFLRSSATAELFRFMEILDAVYQDLALPYRLFQMSGKSFCDDTCLVTLLEQERFAHLPVEVLAPFDQEQELVELAKNAYGTVSMSFHGCILSMIGGCPAIPVTSGEYYNHKFADFNRYAGGQVVPIVTLQSSTPKQIARIIVQYFECYKPEVTACTRAKAAQEMQEWYSQIWQHLQQEPVQALSLTAK